MARAPASLRCSTAAKPSISHSVGVRVAAVLHEGEPFGIGDEVAGELDRADQRAVRGLLIVEMEAVVGVADGVDALVEGDPFARRCVCEAGKRHAGS